MSQLPSPNPHKSPARHTARGPKEKVGAEAPAPSNDFLITPANPISGGDAIPIGVHITSAWLKKNLKTASLSALSVDLAWNDTAIATFRLGKNALCFVGPDKDIQFSTRLKIRTEQGKTTAGKLNAVVKVTPEGQKELPPASAQVALNVEYNDCAAAKIGQLFLSVRPAQSKSGEVVAVKSFIPKPVQASKVLTTIDCTFNAPAADQTVNGEAGPSSLLKDYEIIKVDVTKPDSLADEVFLGFNFVPPDLGLLEMSWQYKNETTNLRASAYLSQTGV